MSEQISTELSFLFSQPIERVWTLIQNLQLLGSLSASNSFPVFAKPTRKTPLGVGSIYEGTIMGITKFTATCTKCKSSPFKKTIQWHFEYQNEQRENNLKITLYNNTSTTGTVLYWKEEFPLCYFMGKNIDQFLTLKNENTFVILEKVQKILTESSINLFQFEGCVIPGTMNDIWSYILDVNKLKKIAPLMCFDVETVSDPAGHIGSTVKVYNEQERYFYMKIEKIDMKRYKNKWMMLIGCYAGTDRIPLQKMVINLVKINNEECYLSMFNELKEPASIERIRDISFKKKYLLANLIDFFENYM